MFYISGVKLVRNIVRWVREETAMAVTESAILFPVLFSLMMAVYDLGNGIVLSQKTITASQVVADLVTRKPNIQLSEVEDAIIAGELALEPYDTSEFGVDVVSVIFDDNDAPEIDWRETRNMLPNEAAVDGAEGLGEEGDGVMVVTVTFRYIPFFSGFAVDQIEMSETFYLHGRRSGQINCEDCTS